VAGLMNGLEDLTNIYIGIDMEVGFGFMLNYQVTWGPYMLRQLRIKAQAFVSKLIITIGTETFCSLRKFFAEGFMENMTFYS